MPRGQSRALAPWLSRLRSTTIWVAMPAWSMPTTHKASLPSIRARRVRMSWSVLSSAWPMCKRAGDVGRRHDDRPRLGVGAVGAEQAARLPMLVPARARSLRGRRSSASSLIEIFPHRLDRLALAKDDRRLDARLVEDFADRRADDAFDPELLLLFDRRLDPAPLDEILRGNEREHLDRAVSLGASAGGEAERHARLWAVVNHDQIGAHSLIPH
jgi:hypothetical protein